MRRRLLLRHALQFRPLENLFQSTAVLVMELDIRLFIRRPRRLVRGRVLIDQVRVLRSASHAEVLHLHHLGQDRLVEMILERWSTVISLVDILVLILEIHEIDVQAKMKCDGRGRYHEEGTTMVVFLEEFVFRLGCLVVDHLRVLLQLGLSLLFGHVVPAFELLFLAFTSATRGKG